MDCEERKPASIHLAGLGMTIDERARFIESQLRTFEKAGSQRGIDKAVEFIAAELLAVKEEQWREDMKHCEASNKQSRSEALEQAGEIVGNMILEMMANAPGQVEYMSRVLKKIRALNSDQVPSPVRDPAE